MKSASEVCFFFKKKKNSAPRLASFPFLPSFLYFFLPFLYYITSHPIISSHALLFSSPFHNHSNTPHHLTSQQPTKIPTNLPYIRTSTYTRAPNPTRLDPTRPKRGVQTRARASFSTIFQGTMTMLIFSFFLLFLPPPLLLLLLRICCTHSLHTSRRKGVLERIEQPCM